MKPNTSFDEVMIVNPYDPRSNNSQRIQFMRFHQAPDPYGYYAQPPEVAYYAEPPEMAYYGEPPEMAYYGEPPEIGCYAQRPEPYGYYAQPSEVGYYAQPPEGTCYAEPPEMGYYAEYPELSGYGEAPEVGGYGLPVNGNGGYAYYAGAPHMASYAEPVAYYAEEYAGQPVGGCAQPPEMVGYQEYEPLAEDYSHGEAYGEPDYGESDVEGYVRDAPSAFNAGCPLPTNVAGYEEAEPLQGYVTPAEVSPTCPSFTPAPGPSASLPETLRPLW